MLDIGIVLPADAGECIADGECAVESGCNERKTQHVVYLAGKRVTTQFSRMSISIFVRRKQSRACSGVFTMGSFSLKEVLSRMGTPFCHKTGGSGRDNEGCLPGNGLQTASAVYVYDCRYGSAFFSANGKYFFHEGHLICLCKIFGRVFL